jgi:hypothetical protein
VFANLSRGLVAALAVSAFTLPALAQNRFASSVVNYTPGANPNPNFSDPTRALAGPTGGGLSNGSLDIVVLGVGGSLTLGFDVTIIDGPGADFTVSENSFVFSGGVFAEVGLVEVSTDGVNFARFPTRYAGSVGPLPPFGVSPMGTFSGMTGGLPVLANVVTNTISPFDPVVSGGDSFDLAELANHPLVTSNLVDLDAIHFVRIVDAQEGVFSDSFGALIWDHGGANSSVDIDAVTALHYVGDASNVGPIVDLSIDAQGHLVLELGHANGFQDLNLATLSVSSNLQPASFNLIRPLLRLQQRTPQGVILRSELPIVGSGIQMALSISVRDLGGRLSADQVILPG